MGAGYTTLKLLPFCTLRFKDLMKQLARLLIILILGLLTVLLLIKLGNIDFSPATLRQINPAYLLVAALIHYSGFLMRGRRWQNLLGGLGYPVRYIYATTLLMSGWFVSALIPARAGDLARAYMLNRDHRMPMAQGLGSIATERALDILVILGLALLAALWALAGKIPPWVWQISGGAGVLLAGLVMALLLTPALEDRLIALWPWPLYQKIARFGFDLLRSIRRLAENPVRLAMALAQSVYIWLCDIFLIHFVFLSLGATIPLSVSAFTGMTVDLAAAAPLVPGAVGQVEGAAMAVLSLFQLNPQQGSLMILLNRLISFWSFILVSGAVTYFFGFWQVLSLKKNPAKD